MRYLGTNFVRMKNTEREEGGGQIFREKVLQNVSNTFSSK
jgi:hypothetical protein